MIRLKNGKEIPIKSNIDDFFQLLLTTIKDEAEKSAKSELTDQNINNYKEILFKTIMDECIFVTHQIFELSKINEKLSKFLVSGFLFNNIIFILTNDNIDNPEKEDNSDDIIH